MSAVDSRPGNAFPRVHAFTFFQRVSLGYLKLLSAIWTRSFAILVISGMRKLFLAKVLARSCVLRWDHYQGFLRDLNWNSPILNSRRNYSGNKSLVKLQVAVCNGIFDMKNQLIAQDIPSQIINWWVPLETYVSPNQNFCFSSAIWGSVWVDQFREFSFSSRFLT